MFIQPVTFKSQYFVQILVLYILNNKTIESKITKCISF